LGNSDRALEKKMDGLITLLTDFGTQDAYVGIMKGVILGINPDARIVDLTHAIPPQAVLPAALALRSAAGFFPTGTVHVAVVDPGVGSVRRPILVETGEGLLVGPDNGVLSLAATVLRRRVIRVIENERFFRHPVSQTFHGRDVFAPVAAHLSRGVEPQQIGPAMDSMVELTVPAVRRTESALRGEVVYVDHFGNLVTNIDAAAMARFPAPSLSVTINGERVAGPVTAYAAVPEGAPLAIVGSWGMMEIAVCNGSAARRFAAGPGTPVTVVVESRDA
jgi:S-adenosyl-L-methionine hydrolase (adenosine-forming)